MPSKTGDKPKSYDDIVRATVVDPDSSSRPTRAQEQLAREGFRALDPDEQRLQDLVQQALAGSGANITGVAIEVSRERVTLRGRVPDVAMLHLLEDAVARVPGVETIHNQVVVAAG
jgi:osmotically-inducible protein OsmY